MSSTWDELSGGQRRALAERLLRRREQLESWPDRHDPPLAAEGEDTASCRERELRELDEALSQVGAGSYGSCPSCGGSVGLAALAEQPLGAECVVCRQALEERRAVP